MPWRFGDKGGRAITVVEVAALRSWDGRTGGRKDGRTGGREDGRMGGWEARLRTLGVFSPPSGTQASLPSY